MSDIYISCAEGDAAVLRLAANALRAEGWSVWCNPVLAAQNHEECENNLNIAGAVMVVWSQGSRDLEHVRSEAAMGMYRNKLVQVNLDTRAPPRPFDQVETTELSGWDGDSSDPRWQRIIAMMRSYAGEPGSARPHVIRRQPDSGRLPLAQARRMAPMMPPVHAERDAALALARMPAAGEASRPVAPPPQPEEETWEKKYERAQRELRDREDLEGRAAPPIASEPEMEPAPREAIRPDTGRQETERASGPVFPPVQPPAAARYEPPPRELPRDPFFDRNEDAPKFARGDDDWARSARIEPEAPARGGPKDPLDVADIGLKASYRDGAWLAEPKRSHAPAFALALALVAAGGAWIFNPGGWRSNLSGGGESGVIAMATGGDALASAAGDTKPVDPELQSRATESWAKIDRSDPDTLRKFIAAFDGTDAAGSARTLLSVADASAWAEAVSIDNQAAYTAYLATFPADVSVPGTMADAAVERLGALDGERQQAIAGIQRVLKRLNYYSGQISGAATPQTLEAIQAAVDAGADRSPSLTRAAPRDLRAYSESLGALAPRPLGEVAAVAAGQQPAEGLAAPAEASPPPASGSPEALTAATLTGPAVVGADAAASAEMMRIEAAAWQQAARTNTDASYRAYLGRFPSGGHATEARGALERINRAPAFSEQKAPASVKAIVAAARNAQASAAQRANAAREAAETAARVAQSSSARDITAPDGDRYRTEIAGGSPNGVGVRTSGKAVSQGDEYRGELRNGLAQGLGVYTFGDNPNNASAGALRYEGEHSGDESAGYGVTYWKNGDRFSGEAAATNGGRGSGVLSYANGQRYEGELRNGVRDGLGVVWSAEGEVVLAGRWENGRLVERAN
jgi:hypothetical protein